MSNPSQGNPGAPDEPDVPADTEPVGDGRPERVVRHIQPLGPRVLVRIVRGPDRSESGLYLPAGAKENSAEALLGEVIEVARTMPRDSGPIEDDDDDVVPRPDLGQNVSGIPVGAQVLFSKEKGIAVPWDETLRLLAVRYILAIVETIREEELQ